MNAELVIDTCQKPTLPVLPIVRLRGLAPMALVYLLAQILIAAQSKGTTPALLSRTTIPTSTLRGHGVDLGRMLSWECDAPSVSSIVKRILQIASINTAIAASTFDGLTYTPVSVSVYQPAVVSSVVYGATLSLSSQTLSLTPKSASDWSTNATLPAAVGTVPYQVAVLCKVA